MSKKTLLVKNYVIVENEDDLFFIFDREYLEAIDQEIVDEFNLETKKYVFVFKETGKIPFEKIEGLKTVGIVVNEDKKEKQHILEGTINHKKSDC